MSAFFSAQRSRVQHSIVIVIISFVAQKIPVGSCVKKSLIACLFPFSDRKCDRAVRKAAADFPDEVYQPVFCVGDIFTALEDKSAQAEFIAFLTAGKYRVFVKTVSAGIPVASADAAVEAVVFAVIGKFDQSPYIDVLSIVKFPYFSCLRKQVIRKFFCPAPNKSRPFLRGKCVFLL